MIFDIKKNGPVFLLIITLSLFNLNVRGQRTIESLNESWKFFAGGTEFADDPGFNDFSWQTISLPHTWNTTDPFDDDETYFRGIGWYRKWIDLDTRFINKKVFLVFEGANQVTDVYVNGAFAGHHKGGYTAFSIDITSFIEWKDGHSKNLIAIQVNNAHDNLIPPLSVGYALYGGIYRDVWLVTSDNLHFKEINNASGGIYITPKNVSSGKPVVDVKTTIANESDKQRSFIFRNTVHTTNGKPVTSFFKEITLAAKEEKTIMASSDIIVSPELWSPENPYLYSVKTELIENGTVVDEVVNPLGFRWFRFSADSGFFLNGKKYFLRGTNRHQDMKGKGSALTSTDHQRDMQLIKDMGANFLRLAHYPQAPDVLRLADKLGLLIWEEIPLVNYMNINPEFLENCKQMLKEMIHQHYNHPSVILWGSMNEILLHNKEGDRIGKHSDDEYGGNLREYAVQLNKLINDEDPSRYSTMALHGSNDYTKYKLDIIAQVNGYNIYDGWYSGKVEDFGRWMDNQHKANPSICMFISEYGAEGEVQLNTEKPERMDYTGQYQRFFHESYLSQINQRPWLAGTAIWNEFDFSQPNIGGPTPHRNQKGLITWDRKIKDAYYLYKANWSPDPVVYIATRNWMTRAGEAGAVSTIDVYANLDNVTISVNGIALTKQKPNNMKKCSWQVSFKNGMNTITATGKKNGKVYKDEVVIEYRQYETNLSAATVFKPIAINVGSNAQYTDPSGRIWIEDRSYTKGSFGYVEGNRQNFDRKKVIKNTNDVPLYYTSRDSLQAYRFDVKDGVYKVTLHFAENKNGESGERVFDVQINNETVLDHFDLAALYGYAQAVKKSFIVTVKNGIGINVEFQTVKGNSTLSGIEVEQ